MRCRAGSTTARPRSARALARDVALAVQAALLCQHAPPAVFAAFCTSRLGAGHGIFGTLPEGCDLDAIVQRAMPH
jgi:putative acyl-CoA dehydrogenase